MPPGGNTPCETGLILQNLPPRRLHASRTSPQANPRRSSASGQPLLLRLLRGPALELALQKAVDLPGAVRAAPPAPRPTAPEVRPFPAAFPGSAGAVAQVAAVARQRGGIGSVIQRADGLQPLPGIAGLRLEAPFSCNFRSRSRRLMARRPMRSAAVVLTLDTPAASFSRSERFLVQLISGPQAEGPAAPAP